MHDSVQFHRDYSIFEMFILPEYVHWESLEVSSRQEGKHLSYAVSLGRAEKMLKMLLV